MADFVYFDACIPSIPLLGFLSCYILHIVKKPLIVLFHVRPCFFIFCGCAYLLCPVVFSWTRTGRSGAAARVVSVIPARALPITYFWALLQKEKERPFIQWGYHVLETVVMELFASSGWQFSNGLSFS